MEALRTRVDGLEWEVQRLDAENRKLRAEKPELGECVDLERELKHMKEDIAVWVEQREIDRRKIDDAEHRTKEAETRVEELEARRHELESDSRQNEESRAIESSLRENLVALESELTVVQDCAADEREALRRQLELDRYRALEEERKK